MLESSGATSVGNVSLIEKRCQEFGMALVCSPALLGVGPIERDVGYADHRPFGEEGKGYEGVEAVFGINRREDSKYASRVSGVRRQDGRYPDQSGIVFQRIERRGVLDIADSPPGA